MKCTLSNIDKLFIFIFQIVTIFSAMLVTNSSSNTSSKALISTSIDQVNDEGKGNLIFSEFNGQGFMSNSTNFVSLAENDNFTSYVPYGNEFYDSVVHDKMEGIKIFDFQQDGTFFENNYISFIFEYSFESMEKFNSFGYFSDEFIEKYFAIEKDEFKFLEEPRVLLEFEGVTYTFCVSRIFTVDSKSVLKRNDSNFFFVDVFEKEMDDLIVKSIISNKFSKISNFVNSLDYLGVNLDIVSFSFISKNGIMVIDDFLLNGLNLIDSQVNGKLNVDTV